MAVTFNASPRVEETARLLLCWNGVSGPLREAAARTDWAGSKRNRMAI
jgi:hypothetical protein